jgi:hypothetical protein
MKKSTGSKIHKAPRSLALIFRLAREAYDNGDPKPMKEALAKLCAILPDPEDEYDMTHEKRLKELVRLFVNHKDLSMLRAVLKLPVVIVYTEETIHAADVRWKKAYDLLRTTLADTPVTGITLYQAFRMKDPTAYEPNGSPLYRKQAVKEFFDTVKQDADTRPGEAIDFIHEIGLARGIDFGLGLEDEWGRPGS